MPSFGADMTSGILSEWRIKPGDRISKGDIIAVIETAKGAIDMEVFQAGTVHSLQVTPGSRVPVGAPIATLVGDTESVPAAPTSPITPAAQTRIKASPLARSRAKMQGIDLGRLSGSGPDGAIIAADLPDTTDTTKTASPPAAPAADPAQMRRAIATAMASSKREIPHYYLASTIDLQPAQTWLTRYNQDKPPEAQLLMTALLHKAIAVALKRSPELNGFYRNDRYENAEQIHLGMAIAIHNGGLIVPALHHTDQTELPQLMQQMRDLTLRARRGGLRSSEMTDATITVSSMGDRGVESLYGVIYPPQVALVGLGTPQIRPWVVDGEVQPRLLVNMTLAADHRVSDGHQGGLFLRRVDKLLQKPETL